MGMEWSSASEGGGENEYETEVMVNVYDLTPINNYISFFGFGIFHSGIQVHGREYGFGAHEYPMSGVFEVEPKCCPGFVYRCSVSLGRISMPPSEFRQFLEAVASEYHGDTYHLISKNCNHFTNDIAFRLTGKCIPGWVNRLAKLGAFCNCLLPESLQETTVKHLPEYHSHAEDDASRSPSTSSHHELTESDDDSDRDNKHLLPPLSGPEVAFIKEVSNSGMELFVAVQGQPNSLF